MPKVPILFAPGRLAPVRQSGARPSAQDFDVGTGQIAVGRALQDAGEVSFRLGDALMRGRANRAAAEAAREIRDKREELRVDLSRLDDPQEIEAVEARFREAQNDILQAHREQLTFPAYKGVFDQYTHAEVERSRLEMREQVRAKQLDLIRADAITAYNLNIEEATRAESDMARQDAIARANRALEEARANGAISAERAAELRARGEAVLRSAEDIRQSQEAADSIFARFDDPEERLRYARENFSGPQEDAIVGRIKDLNQQEREERERADRERYDAAGQAALSGNLTREEALRMPGLSTAQRANLISIIENRNKPTQFNYEAYYAIKDLLTNPNTRDAAADLDLMKYFHLFAGKPEKFEALLDLQRKGGASESFVESKVKTALAELLLPFTDAALRNATEDKKKQAIAFRRNFEEERARREAEKKRSLNETEIRDLLEEGKEQIEIERDWWPDLERPRFVIRRVDIENVPREALPYINADLKKANIPQTPAAQLDAFWRMIRRGEWPRVLERPPTHQAPAEPLLEAPPGE